MKNISRNYYYYFTYWGPNGALGGVCAKKQIQ